MRKSAKSLDKKFRKTEGEFSYDIESLKQRKKTTKHKYYEGKTSQNEIEMAVEEKKEYQVVL